MIVRIQLNKISISL